MTWRWGYPWAGPWALPTGLIAIQNTEPPPDHPFDSIFEHVASSLFLGELRS